VRLIIVTCDLLLNGIVANKIESELVREQLDYLRKKKESMKAMKS